MRKHELRSFTQHKTGTHASEKTRTARKRASRSTLARIFLLDVLCTRKTTAAASSKARPRLFQAPFGQETRIRYFFLRAASCTNLALSLALALPLWATRSARGKENTDLQSATSAATWLTTHRSRRSRHAMLIEVPERTWLSSDSSTRHPPDNSLSKIENACCHVEIQEGMK